MEVDEVNVDSDGEEVTFILSVKAKDHEFDNEAYRKSRVVCDYPSRVQNLQIQGERGPRYYNRVTPDQQIAAFVNKTVQSMI